MQNTLQCAADDFADEVQEAMPKPDQQVALRRPSASDFRVPFRGEPEDIKPFLGRVSLIVNVKFDDPETLQQMPALQSFVEKYSKDGLSVLAFPTDQVWLSARRSRVHLSLN